MRILIGLIEHIGDIVACEPVSRYIRYKYPDAHVSWAVRAPFRELIDCNPHVDETIVLECLTDWMKLEAHGSYDEVVDLHVNYRICQHCRIPLAKKYGNPLISVHEWFDYGALLEAFSQAAGLPKLSAQPELYLGPEHSGAVDALELPERFCVVHRKSSMEGKDWLDGNWRALAEWINAELGMPIVEIGANAPAEQSPLDGLALDLTNRIPILQSAEVIRRARFCIAIDSGPAHLANAVLTPGVVLLGQLGYFRSYNPFTGYYASELPGVRIVRNPTGPVSRIPLADVQEAVRYVGDFVAGRESAPAPLTGALPAASIVGEGQRSIVRASGAFDAAWYAVHYPDFLDAGIDALDHFIARGGQQGNFPGPKFDSALYLKRHPDVAAAGTNPLLHYLEAGGCGNAAFPTPRPLDDKAAPDFASGRLMPLSQAASAQVDPHEFPRTFAFYLPQFHPVPENDSGHRKGFTEWDNVIKARPLFPGHYQPRLPGELGYYDLRATEVMRDQVRLASEHGITGFCFYYYYFGGKRGLYKPIENFIGSDIDFPFFFLWANENWSRRWDGGDDEVIVAQRHSPEDDLAFIRGLTETFADRRYVKINGKPLLLVYKIHLFPDIRRTVECWRNEIEKLGFPGIYLVMVDDWTSDPCRPREFGFDASYEIPSNIVPSDVLVDEPDRPDLDASFEGRIVDYRKFAQYHMARPFPDYKRFRTVMLPWDNTPRYASRAMVHVNTAGDWYTKWLTRALLATHNRYPPEERIVFLHSWNEWCEGTYLEPDGRFGNRYLRETRDAIGDARAAFVCDQEGAGDALPLIHRLLRENEQGAFRIMNTMRSQIKARNSTSQR